MLDAVKARGFLVKYGAYFTTRTSISATSSSSARAAPGPRTPTRSSGASSTRSSSSTRPAAERDPAAARHGGAGSLRRRRRDRAPSPRARARGRYARASWSTRAGATRSATRHGKPPPHRGSRQGGAVRPLPGRQALAREGGGQHPDLQLRAGLVLVHPVRERTSSVGCVLHARTILRGRERNLEQLYPLADRPLPRPGRGARRGAPASRRCTARPTSPTTPSPPSATASCAWATRSRSWTPSSRPGCTSRPSPRSCRRWRS